MLSHVTCGARKTLHSHLTSYCIKQIYKSRLKHQVTFYCSQYQNPEFNAHSYNAHKKEPGRHNEGKISKFTKGNDELDPSISRITHYIKQAYATPLADLKNFYVIVHNEFKKDCMSITYSSGINEYTCTIDVTWPTESSFSAVGRSKKAAGHEAALSCLVWLHANNRVKNKKPILYTNVRHFLTSQEIVDVNFQRGWKHEMQSLIEEYNQCIAPVIKAQLDTSVVQKEDPLESCEENSMTSDSQPSKNSLLRPSLSKRQVGDLPINKYKDEILKSIAENQTVIIKGDTGCGKSTQIPQFILDEYIDQNRGHDCNIVVAEPRRISAVSLAHHVAWQRNENVGEVVGYQVRFESVKPQMGGSIVYYTTGILVRKLELDNSLEGVTHVIIDEAHERSLQTDILLKFFKDMLKRKPQLKLIIMSASMNTELFQKYFSCPIIDVPGKMYPVQQYFLDDIPMFMRNYHQPRNIEVPYEQIVQTIKWIIMNKPPGAILCFLPGWQEIKKLHSSLLDENIKGLYIITLHSKIPIHNQQKAFQVLSGNMTKVILSTDIAETGITISDVTYVIDTAISRQLEWNENKLLSSLNLNFVSKANIIQRKGRAGRVRSGECYHLITRKQYEKLDEYSKPEILKIPLEETIVIIKNLCNEKAHDFFDTMIESPSKTAISNALANLKKLKILDDDENLTSLGKRISYFSINPKLSVSVILSTIFQCLDPVLSIATMFSSTFGPSVSLDEATSVNVMYKDQKQSYHRTSDHIAMLHYYENMQNVKSESLFNSLQDTRNEKHVHALKQLYLLHMNNLISAGMISTKFDYKLTNVYSKNNELIRAILFAGTNHLVKRNSYGFKNGCFTSNTNEFIAEDAMKVKIKVDSVNSNRRTWPSELMTYVNKMEFVRRNSCLVNDTSIISPLSVLLFSQGDVYYENDNYSPEKVVICLNNMENVKLLCEKETVDLLLNFRSILWDMAFFIIKYEGDDNNINNLNLIKSYKQKLMPFLSEILHDASKDIDDISHDEVIRRNVS